MLRISTHFCVLLVWIATSLAGQIAGSQEPLASIEALKNELKKASQLLKERKLSDCVASIDLCTASIRNLSQNADMKDAAELKRIHTQIAKAHELLALDGAELVELPPWEKMAPTKGTKAKPSEPATPKTSGTPSGAPGAVSFSKDIAPWMVEQCSRCHIARSQGGFSMATFNDLMKGSKGGVVLFAGDAVGSRLVETIETGDMPRGGGKVSPENLLKLKQWITEGAKFDGNAMTAPLASLASGTSTSSSPQPTKADAPSVRQPTGKETVSFARDVAPILTANCNGCHYAATRPSGELLMNTYTQLLKGGESGAAIESGKGDDSLIVKKIRGMSGQRMPAGGRPALSEESIKLITTWIKEGATFDGSNPESRLDQVIGQAWASNASHEELHQKRIQRAQEHWKIVSPKTEPEEASDNHFHIIGNIGSESSKKLLAHAKTADAQVRKLLGIKNKDPLIKGGITIFALKQRYDYSEFGTMLERRTLPTDWSSHWRLEILDSYVALVYDKAEPRINESSLIQQIASLWVASHEGVPKWFADGAGRQALAMAAGQNDLRVQTWVKRLPDSMKQLDNLSKFLKGDINDEDAATIGFGIVRFMNDSSRKKQYDALLRSLASGVPFEQSMLKNIGPLEPFLQQLLGKKK
jgi:mono/diheme cytochrome c family protein